MQKTKKNTFKTQSQNIFSYCYFHLNIALEYPLKAHTDSLGGFKNQGDSITTPNQHFDSDRSNKNHYVSGFHWYVQERG